jgi:hypothetical protein
MKVHLYVRLCSLYHSEDDKIRLCVQFYKYDLIVCDVIWAFGTHDEREI